MGFKVEDHFMDKKEPSSEVREEAARESLIAISHALPETDANSAESPKNSITEEAVQPQKSDGEDKYRSKLISISSYLPSPDAMILPMLPGQPQA